VNQAYSTNAGDRVIQNGTSEIWAKPLPEVVNNAKSFGVVLFNRNDTDEAEITLHFTALNMTDMTQCGVRDLWMGKDSAAKGSITMSVNPHDVAFLRLSACFTPKDE
jgi:hypothetical protein